MEVRLRVLGGKNAGQEVPVGGPTFVIGRAEGCQLRPKSDLIAERHCAIDVETAQAILRDLGSPSGTFVNGERLTGPHQLRPGDKLKVGPLEFEAVVKIGLASKKKPKVDSVEEAASRLAAGGRRDVDVTKWLDDAPGNSAVASRYAAAFSDKEKDDLGLSELDLGEAEEETPPAAPSAQAPPKPAEGKETQQAAMDILSKYLKKK